MLETSYTLSIINITRTSNVSAIKMKVYTEYTLSDQQQ